MEVRYHVNFIASDDFVNCSFVLTTLMCGYRNIICIDIVLIEFFSLILCQLILFLSAYLLILFWHVIQGPNSQRLDISLARSETLEINEHSSSICGTNDIILEGTQSS